VTFDNGYDALMAIGARKPDLLVLDLKMPGLNGTEIVRRLKENELTRIVPIIVISVYDTPEWR
jgi:CheY-like chemotaxis protein